MMTVRKFSSNMEPRAWLWVVFHILNFGIDRSGWTVAGALEWAIFGVPCSAEC